MAEPTADPTAADRVCPRFKRARAAVALATWASFAVGCSLVTDLDVLTHGDGGAAATDGAPADAATSGDSGAASDGSSYREVVLADGPAAYWRLGDAPGEIHARDETGHGNDGTYVGGVSLGAAGAIAGDTAAHFDGSGYVTIGDKFEFTDTAAMSIEVWMAVESQGDPEIVNKETYHLFLWANSLRYDRLGTPNCACIAFEGDAGAIKDGQYHHIVATYDTVTMSLYLDGTRVKAIACSSLIPASDAALTLAPNGYLGRLDEVAIYDKVLPEPNVKKHFDARSAP